MNEITLSEVARSLIIVSTFVIFLGFIVKTMREWGWMELDDKALHVGVGLFLIAMGARSYIAIKHGDPLVWSLWFYLAGLGCFVVYLTAPRGYKK